MHGIGAVVSSGWATDDFDAGSVFTVGVEQLVDVTEARSAQRDTLFCQQEGTTGTGAGQHGGADGSVALLTSVAVDVHAGQTVGDFLNVLMVDQTQFLIGEDANAGIDGGKRFGSSCG